MKQLQKKITEIEGHIKNIRSFKGDMKLRHEYVRCKIGDAELYLEGILKVLKLAYKKLN